MSVNSSSEELRKLLASDDQSPTPAFRRASSHATTSMELSSLLSSLNTGNNMGILIDTPLKRPSVNLSSSQPLPTYVIEDTIDFTVVTFGTQCSIRSRLGKYLTAVLSESLPTTTSSTVTKVFSLGVDGQGIGDAMDALAFINADSREDLGPIRYGSVVAIKAPAAKERLLGSREGKLGFWRNLIGQGEKWVILKASAKGVEETGSRGLCVRLGDAVLLCSSSTFAARGGTNDELLSLYEGAEGREPRLVNIDRAGLGDEVWRVDLFNSQPLPSWSHRVYLSGNVLCRHSSLRQPTSDMLTRTFPGVPIAPPPTMSAYSSLPVSLQQRVLVRELLLALSGIEGDVVRVAAVEPDPSGAPSSKELVLKDLKLVINAELTADRSLANHLAVLLPMCESVIRVRDFVKTHSVSDNLLFISLYNNTVHSLITSTEI
jgi:hypothetical protein